MDAEEKSIRYRIFFKSSKVEIDQTVVLNDGNFEHPAQKTDIPDWCQLGYKQCPNCTLSPIWHPYCPLAVRLIPFVNLPACNSYDEVSAKVEMENKVITTETSAQEALSSLVGLVIATSGCPHTRFFKPLAWFHNPFSSPEETLYRTCAAYLFSCISHRKPDQPEISFELLKEIYKNIHIINVNIAARIHNHSETDSVLNAIVLIDLITKELPITIDDDLSDVKRLFQCHKTLFE